MRDLLVKSFYQIWMTATVLAISAEHVVILHWLT